MTKNELKNQVMNYIGRFKITCKYKDGKVTEEWVKNSITDGALNALIESLDGTNPDIEIKYLAVGTDNSAIDNTDTQLGAEIFRTQDTSGSRTDTGEFTSNFVILDSEAVATWEEIGIFCGSTATASANSGLMLSRILYNKTKTALEEVNIARVDTLERG